MNKDTREDNWKQLRDAVKQRCEVLTDNDLDGIVGKPDKVAGLLQERYGYTRRRSRKEIYLFLGDIRLKGEYG